MLTRIYIDNFRCFVNFEYRPERKQLILGRNGSGKSSLFAAMFLLQQFAIRGAEPLDVLFNQRTRWVNKARQTFELDAMLDGKKYAYKLVTEPDELPQARVSSESLEVDGRSIVKFMNAEVVFNDDTRGEIKYSLEWSRSALATISPRTGNDELKRFKQWFGDLSYFKIDPSMDAWAQSEESSPNPDLSNLVAWYRRLILSHPAENSKFLEALHEVFDGFDTLRFHLRGENVRLLFAQFIDKRENIEFSFAELSDGQRCLVCLYMILHFLLARGRTVMIDEPDNFISLREIQPWLIAVEDMIEERGGQMLVISHHPEFINQWAPASGVRFVRDGIGAVQVEPFRGDPESPLSPAELVARGWESG